mgnify:FL=1
MSATINDGGPAFPVPIASSQPGELVSACELGAGGMSLRDWFAGQALAAMTVAPDYSKGPCNYEMAERAYIIADRMLEVRSKGGAA